MVPETEQLLTLDLREFDRRVLGPLARLRRRFRAYLLVEGVAVVLMLVLIVAGIAYGGSLLLFGR